MTKLLHIDSSVLGSHSVSRQLSAAIVDRLKRATPDLDVVYRDLTVAPLAHLSGPHLAAAQRHGIGTLYVSVEISEGHVANSAELAAFIRICRLRGIDVIAVEGDPAMIRGMGRDNAVQRAKALAEYQGSVGPQERFGGF